MVGHYLVFCHNIIYFVTLCRPILKSSGNNPSDDHHTGGFNIRIDNGSLHINIKSCDTNTQASLKEPVPSGWFHLIVTFHPQNFSRIDIFIDGNHMETDTWVRASAAVLESPHLTSGSNITPQSGTRRMEYGLSNVKIFNHKLSVDEVKRLYYDDANRK